MTREELRDYVEEQRNLKNISYHVYSALIDGIDTLEQEPCKNTTSRQAAIDIIERWLSCDDYNKAERHIMRAMQSVLYDLPSVNSQPKIGHWEWELIRDEIGGCIGAKMSCSECGNDNKYDEYMNYCPNCGAKMFESQESEG